MVEQAKLSTRDHSVAALERQCEVHVSTGNQFVEQGPYERVKLASLPRLLCIQTYVGNTTKNKK